MSYSELWPLFVIAALYAAMAAALFRKFHQRRGRVDTPGVEMQTPPKRAVVGNSLLQPPPASPPPSVSAASRVYAPAA
eukprot:gene315-6043_t